MIRIVQLGSPRHRDEGLRLGTVRRPPRGVRKEDYATKNYYDVWMPDLAPSAELFARRPADDDEKSWQVFARKYESELKRPEASRLLDLLAALSHQTNFSVGCYCDNEARCHRSVLRRVLAGRGAAVP
ncbi:MAG: DUF488 domain-containing protein [Vicinamibacterales bacterium]